MNKRNIIKLLSFFICITIVLSSLAACIDTSNNSTDPSNTPGDSPANTPGNTPEDTPENTPGNTPGDTPASTPDETPVGSDSSGDKEPPKENTISYDLSKYSLVRPMNSGVALKLFSETARNKINGHIDHFINLMTDFVRDGEITDEIKNAKEILVGQTNREESAEALKKLTEDDTYIITVINNKIVINAKEEGIAAVGALYFANEIASKADGTVVDLEEGFCYISKPVKKIVFDGSDNADVKIIYSKELNPVVNGETNEADYVYDITKTFRDFMETEFDTDFPLGSDSAAYAKPIEISVGTVEREEFDEFYYTLGYNEYGFKVVGSKLVITGTNPTTTNLALENAKVVLKKLTTENKDGTKSLVLYEGMESVCSTTLWYVDIPKFEGGKYVGTHDADGGDLMIYFEKTTAAAFEAYCDKLEAAGYTLWQRNDIENNLHATYTNEDGLVHVTYTDFSKTVRIVTTKDGGYTLPRNPEKEEYQKVTDSYITQMACDYTYAQYGMLYIITLEDGSFVVFDSGDDKTNYDDKIYQKLKELNKRRDGKIVIAGWFLSHVHHDHYHAFMNFCRTYYSKITIEQVFYNTTSPEFEFNTVSDNRYIQKNIEYVQRLCRFDIVNVHTGMKFYLRNAEFEILHTEEDIFPDQPFYFNDTSIVWRMTIAGQTSLWTGDAADVTANIMVRRYPKTLKSDMVQLSHHGYVGCTSIFYMKVNAGVLFWPTSQKGYNDMNKPTYRYYAENKAAETRAHTVLLASVDRTIKLPFSKGDEIIIG